MKYTFTKTVPDAGEIEAQVASEVGIKPDFVTATEDELTIAFPEPLAGQSEDKLRLLVRNLRPDLEACLKEGK